jgi:uncharacterized protein
VRQAPSIDAYGGGGFRIDGVRHEGSILVIDDAPLPWDATAVETLTAADFEAVFNATPGTVEFVLLGTGVVQALPPRAVREAIAAAGMGLEFMATEAAARTYNLLASEGRRLACALIAV